MILRSVTAIVIAVGLVTPSVVSAQECLHSGQETPAQKERRTAALRATRQVNTLQARAATGARKGYLAHDELASFYAESIKGKAPVSPLAMDPGSEVIPGWQLTLDRTEDGYWFMIKDKTDPCGFAYVSNQEGLIYTAEVIR